MKASRLRLLRSRSSKTPLLSSKVKLGKEGWATHESQQAETCIALCKQTRGLNWVDNSGGAG